MKKLLIPVLLFSAIGCHTTFANQELEKLHGITWQEDRLQVLVSSNGCTDAESFLVVREDESISIIRPKPDYCRRLPFTLWIELKTDLPAEIRVLNPLRPG